MNVLYCSNNQDYRVLTDKFNYILQVKRIVQDGENKGNEYWENIAYSGNISSLLRSLIEEKLKVDFNFEDIQIELNNIKKEINNLIKEEVKKKLATYLIKLLPEERLRVSDNPALLGKRRANQELIKRIKKIAQELKIELNLAENESESFDQ